MPRVCIVCQEEEISDRSKFDIGPRCRAHVRHWANRPLKDRLERASNLKRYSRRISMIDNDKNIIDASKRDAPKNLNSEVYLHLTKDLWVKRDQLPEEIASPPKRPPGKPRLKVAKIANNTLRAPV